MIAALQHTMCVCHTAIGCNYELGNNLNVKMNRVFYNKLCWKMLLNILFVICRFE